MKTTDKFVALRLECPACAKRVEIDGQERFVSHTFRGTKCRWSGQTRLTARELGQ